MDIAFITAALDKLAAAQRSTLSSGCCLLYIALGRIVSRRRFRFYRQAKPDVGQGPSTQQTKGSCPVLLMGLLEELLVGATGKSWDQLKEPVRQRWESIRWLREPVQKRAKETYDFVPRADLVLTAIGTAISILAVRRTLRRYRTAQEIPLDLFRRQKKLKGFAVSVNDSDNIRFYHSSPLASLLFRRPNVKRPDLKYETINVRLAGIDAPEMAHFGGECQPYAKEAKEWLTNYVDGRRVTIQLLRFDQYSRAVASVYVGWLVKRNVSVEMIKAGFATIYEDAGAEYGGAEKELRRHLKEAQTKRLGMWKQSWTTYVSPSQYKKNLKLTQDPAGMTTSPADKWKLSKLAFWNR